LEDWRKQPREEAERISAWRCWNEGRWRGWRNNDRGSVTRTNNKRDECQKENRWKQLTRSVDHRTGSHPPALSGEQRAIRRAPIQLPLSTPYFMIASSVYREQLGSNRQLDGSHAKRIR
jgi:hypothetical protein